MADLTSFATVDEMRDRSNGEISTATHPSLQKELDGATKAIRNACGWHIAAVQTLRFVSVSQRPSLLFLNAMEIRSITACYLNGALTSPLAVEVDPMTGETNVYTRAVDITFTAGYTSVPADLVTLTLELAAGGLGAGNILREQAGDVAITYARSGGSLLPQDAPRLAAYTLQAIP